MKKKRRNTARPPALSAATPGDDMLHFRLCHLCLHLNESAKEIVQCKRCNRFLTIESMVEERLRQKRSEDSEDELGEEAQGRMVGLNGLAVLW